MESKYIKTVLKLNRLTKENELIWETSRFDPNSISGTERMVGNAFVTTANDKQIRLYKFEYRHYTDEDEFFWAPDFRLEFIDSRGNGSWQFPDDRTITDLYETVTYKTSGAEEFVDGFLDEEDLK
mgnify:CR=1 FL=1|jgi:hypothetical protein|tara:strand:- start:56 stop:430 length:375 start_codon:yes stop_codon:yes gene_type:complete